MDSSNESACEPVELAADEVGIMRRFFSRLFGKNAEPIQSPVQRCTDHEGRLAADGKGGGSRPAINGARAAGPPLAKSLGAVAFIAQKLEAWDDDIEAMNAVAAALNHEAIQEKDESGAPSRMLEVVDEFRRVRDRLGQLMVEIAQEEAGEIAEGTEEENDIIMNAARVLKAINEAAQENDVRKSGREISAANAAHLAKCGAHLEKAAHHHERLGSHLQALRKCCKASGAGIDEAEEHLDRAQEHHDAIGEHHELARLHLSKVGAANEPEDEPEGEIEDLTLDEMIASALDSGGLRKHGGARRIVAEMIALIRKNAELEARLAALDNTPARPKARLFAVHKGDEARALVEQAGERASAAAESFDPGDRDAFRKVYRNTFANPRSIRDPMFKGSAGGAL